MNNAEHEPDAERPTEAAGSACAVDTDTNESNDDFDSSHLDNVDDGCGCTEIWEHLSEQRERSE
jgi:hypothetical protein